MSTAPRPFVQASDIDQLLRDADACRKRAAKAREIEAQFAALPEEFQPHVRYIRDRQAAVAQQCEEQCAELKTDAVERVRQLWPVDAKPFLVHSNPEIRLAAIAAVCKTPMR